MGIFDRLMGRDDRQRREGGSLTDEQAVDRYRYLLRTAPPETIEQAHEEAFARLTPDQRRMVLDQLLEATPERERPRGDEAQDPRALARLATRAEMRRPGMLERAFGGIGGGMAGGGMGFGGLMAGSFLASMAGTMLGGMVAQQFFQHQGLGDPLSAQGFDDAAMADAGSGDGMGASGLDSAGMADPLQDQGLLDGVEDVDTDFGGGFDDVV